MFARFSGLRQSCYLWTTNSPQTPSNQPAAINIYVHIFTNYLWYFYGVVVIFLVELFIANYEYAVKDISRTKCHLLMNLTSQNDLGIKYVYVTRRILGV